MKVTDAKKLLELHRPGQPAAPGTEEALDLLKKDPELAEWHEQQKAFNATMASAVASIFIPAGLRHSLLSEQAAMQRAPWWKRRVSIPVAAAIFVFLALAGAFLQPNQQTFANYRNDIIDESWGRSPHLDFETSDLEALNRWVASYDPHASVSVPAGLLMDMTVQGGRILEWNKHTVVLVCLVHGGKHLHLFAMHDRPFSDGPVETRPDYEKCNGWKTVSWRHGDETFVLTGMNYYTFLKKFRHARHWQIDG